MNKSELVKEIAKVLPSNQAAEAAVNSILSRITEAIVQGETVTLVGFGTFKPVRREARSARNPRTGETVTVPARTVAKFIPGKKLKESANQ